VHEPLVVGGSFAILSQLAQLLVLLFFYFPSSFKSLVLKVLCTIFALTDDEYIAAIAHSHTYLGISTKKSTYKKINTGDGTADAHLCSGAWKM
jgi:hypothetical protein